MQRRPAIRNMGPYLMRKSIFISPFEYMFSLISCLYLAESKTTTMVPLLTAVQKSLRYWPSCSLNPKMSFSSIVLEYFILSFSTTLI